MVFKYVHKCLGVAPSRGALSCGLDLVAYFLQENKQQQKDGVRFRGKVIKGSVASVLVSQNTHPGAASCHGLRTLKEYRDRAL
jgi:uncharacterized protein YwbE